MPIVKMQEQEEYELLPEGETLKVRIMGIELKEIPYRKDGEDKVWTPLEWTFKVTEGEHQGKTTRATTDNFVSNSDLNTLRPFIEACLGTKMDPDLVIDTDDFVGKEVYGLIGHRTDKKDRTWDQITEIFPLGSGQGEEVPF